MKKLQLAVLAALSLLSGLAGSATPADGRKTYIVQLRAEPAASYQGGVAGLAATQAAPGTRFRYGATAVQAYVSYLGQQQRSVAATVGRAPVLRNYTAAFNGFAARLTAAEVATLRTNAHVADVFEDVPRRLDTVSTPNFLKLTAPGGLWSQLAGGTAVKGEGLVVGIIDGGIWPEHPSFADRVDTSGRPVFSGGTLAFGAPPAGFSGGCVAGEGFNPALHCNNKLIGAKFYNAGFLASGLPKHWSEFYSPRDSGSGPKSHGGHGSHTASTAAGNSGVPTTVAGIGLPLGAASGMAPRARIASYKVCWTYDDPTATDGTDSSNTCFPSDSIAAIDDAVKDGVHAINFSIGSGVAQTTLNDPTEQAFYRAALAGVFVATSAGNSGPGTAVNHVGPWVMAVGASTHDRAFTAQVTLGNAASYSGASVNGTALPQTALIRAEDAGLPGANADNLKLCFSASANGGSPVLDPVKVKGKIVVCTRGDNARVDKSAAVKEATGVGMIQIDNGGGLVAEPHSVPTVHVTATSGAAITAYISQAGSSATAALGTFSASIQDAPTMAGFSSRGPNQADGNLMKPDITAPGVDIAAAYAADINQAQRDAIAAGTLAGGVASNMIGGTSMASPHIAGLSLLIKQAHPTWSPAAIKSALMTTATSTLNDGVAGLSNGLLPWSQGAGHVNPNAATDPGLVYDAAKADYASYQCKVNRTAVPASDCATYGTLDETYNLNQPSITISTLVGTVTVRRTVTNVGSSTATYNAAIHVPGFTAEVSPATLTLAPGAKGTFTVRLVPGTAVEGVWQYGALVWTDGSHVVRSPVQLRLGKAITAPDLITGNTASGSRLFTVRTGFAGRMGAVRGGLKDVTMLPVETLAPKATSGSQLLAACTAGSSTANIKVHNISIPADTLVAKFATRNADTGNPGEDDFDMLIMKAEGGSVVYSGNDRSNEAVQLVRPAAGNYRVCVVAWETASGKSTMTYALSSWVVTKTDAGGGLNVLLPGVVYTSGTSTVGVTWSGITAGRRTLGAVQFLDAGGLPQATTVLQVENNSGAPVNSVADGSLRKPGLSTR